MIGFTMKLYHIIMYNAIVEISGGSIMVLSDIYNKIAI